jgi:hypothetical protein
MKKFIIVLSIFVFVFSTLFSQEKYSKVKIFTGETGLKKLAGAGIDITEGIIKEGVYFETDLSESEISKVKSLGLPLSVEIKDLEAFFAERAAAAKDLKITRNRDEEWPVPQNWEYGSMGGFYTLQEVMNELDSMRALYPSLISQRAPVSDDTLTHEGRKIWWARISDNPDVNEDEPEVLYTGLHHAREPMSVQQMIWYMWYLLENYDSNPEIKNLVDNTEMYFVPVANPDGYEYNHTQHPGGGGMWRKTRRNNGDGTYGVDPNRNYSFKWGYDNSGSSPNPGDETYRGPYAFSEPCMKNMRDFANNHEFLLALNYHSYSNLLLYPWGYTVNVTPDNDLMHDFAALLTKENNYTYGPSSSTIYPTNGDANDWMYGEQTTKGKIISFTPEIGNASDNFWPPVSRIIPLCREQMWQNITAARLVGKYAVLTDRSSVLTDQTENYAAFVIKRLGLTHCNDFKVFITPLDNNIVSVGDTLHFYDMEIMEEQFDSIEYVLRPGIEEGTEFRYLLSVDNGQYVNSDTITKYFGTEIVIFSDDCENMDNWTSSVWDITTESYTSPSHSITDSPYTNYNNNQTAIITLDSTLDLRNTPVAFIRYNAKWKIEAGFDYVEILVKEYGSSNWVPMKGKYTHSGSVNQDEGEPLYDGVQNGWVSEEVKLDQFAGKKINIMFKLVSDTYVTKDGFYFDDFSVSVISSTVGLNENNTGNGMKISLFPNPAKDVIKVFVPDNGKKYDGVKVQIFSAAGKEIKSLSYSKPGTVLRLDIANLQQGIYFIRVNKGDRIVTKRFVKM